MTFRLRASKAESYGSIEETAQGVRRALGFDLTGRMPGLRLFESLDNYCVELDGERIPLRYGVEELDAEVEAEARFENDGRILLSLSPRTYQELEFERPRARFTVFHEIGHAVLHAAELVRLSRIPRHQMAALCRGEIVEFGSCWDVEWQANAFAAALSMPARGLEHLCTTLELTPRAVAREFAMSTEAADLRIKCFQEKRHALLKKFE